MLKKKKISRVGKISTRSREGGIQSGIGRETATEWGIDGLSSQNKKSPSMGFSVSHVPLHQLMSSHAQGLYLVIKVPVLSYQCNPIIPYLVFSLFFLFFSLVITPAHFFFSPFLKVIALARPFIYAFFLSSQNGEGCYERAFMSVSCFPLFSFFFFFFLFLLFSSFPFSPFLYWQPMR